jgi:hypothetical protein
MIIGKKFIRFAWMGTLAGSLACSQVGRFLATATPPPTPTPTTTATLPPTPTITPTPTLDRGVQNPDNGHWYRVVFDRPLRWRAARDYCVSLGAHLVTLESTAESDFVFELNPYGWMGATDEEHEGTWKWVTDQPWKYTHWAPGEPNNCGGSGNSCTPEHYLTFHGDYPALWNDIDDMENSFTCEWDQ